MKTAYLLPKKYKTIGWILFIAGLISGMLSYVLNFNNEILVTNVFTIYSDSFLGDSSFFKIIENSILDELIALSIIVGGLIVGFSKEKVEDEFIYKLRTDSLVWAIICNYLVLLFTILFVYDMTFFDVLIFNMFTPLVIFVFRFNFLKLKSQGHDE